MLLQAGAAAFVVISRTRSSCIKRGYPSLRAEQQQADEAAAQRQADEEAQLQRLTSAWHAMLPAEAHKVVSRRQPVLIVMVQLASFA